MNARKDRDSAANWAPRLAHGQPDRRSFRWSAILRYILPVVAGFLGGRAVAQTAPIPPAALSPEALWPGGQPPFSFIYNGRASGEFLASWRVPGRDAVGRTAGSSPTEIVFIDPVTHLRIVATLAVNDAAGALDWVLEFENQGDRDTPLLEAIEPLDATFASTGAGTVHHARGSKAQPDDFAPLTDVLAPGKTVSFESTGGRSSQGSLPFFNLETDHGGVIGAIGWTGHWRASFTAAEKGGSIRVQAGMTKTHLVLHPGEKIRTPRIVLMKWSGEDWNAGQNRWRQYILQQYTPQENGHPVRGPIAYATWGADRADHKLAQIELIRREHLPFDVFWVDAGWYGNCEGHLETDPHPFWRARGSWVPNPANYPNGLRPIADAAHAAGLKFLLWFEPEEADPGTILAREHPEWFYTPPRANNPGSEVIKLGDPTARRGITDLVAKILSEDDVDWYRQDFNLDPERTFAGGDTPDRVGMTEIQYIESLYTFLDELKARRPGLRIDNCASGGQRLDIEMLRRSVALWRSDRAGPPDGDITSQTQTQGLAPWVPLNGAVPWTTPGPFDESPTPPDPFDARQIYILRSGYSAALVLGLGQAAGKDAAWAENIRRVLAEYKRVQPYISGDFHPLSQYTQSPAAAVAWQWHRPDQKSGVVIALRRSGCGLERQKLQLHDIHPAATYVVETKTSLDPGVPRRMSGRELAFLTVDIADQPGSALVFYHEK